MKKAEFIFPLISCLLLVSTFVLGIQVIRYDDEVEVLEETITLQKTVINQMNDTFFLYSKYSLKVLELQQIRTDEVITRFVSPEYEYSVRKDFGEYRYNHVLQTDECRKTFKELQKTLEQWKQENR